MGVIRQRLRDATRHLRRGIRQLTQPQITRERIARDLGLLGIQPGQTVLVHSSLASLGNVLGGADEVIEGLIEAVGPAGTLVLPTHSWRAMEHGCRVFDVRNTPCCVGAIPERFRNRPGVLRSLHPSHSIAALGPRAAELVQGHESCATPCGAGTPYEKILETGGSILLLGTDLRSLTVFHTLEALARVPYLMKLNADHFEIVDHNGASRRLAIHRHEAAIARRFGEQEKFLAQNRVLRHGRVGRARSILVAGDRFLATLSQALAEDPSLLIPHPPDRRN